MGEHSHRATSLGINLSIFKHTAMFFTLLSMLVVGIVQIQCKCPSPEECSHVQCPGQVDTRIIAPDYSCCAECVKIEGATCGGQKTAYGNCDEVEGLYCADASGEPVDKKAQGHCKSKCSDVDFIMDFICSTLCDNVDNAKKCPQKCNTRPKCT